MKLTNNFSLKEFKCNCGCSMPSFVKDNVLKLVEDLQVIREKIDKPIKITNAYRCKSHNAKVGGAKNSQHLLGKAADLQVKDVKPKEVADLVESLMKSELINKGGVGRYSSFTHVDIRGTDARWDFTNKK